jgi:hypothetical protein
MASSGFTAVSLQFPIVGIRLIHFLLLNLDACVQVYNEKQDATQLLLMCLKQEITRAFYPTGIWNLFQTERWCQSRLQ